MFGRVRLSLLSAAVLTLVTGCGSSSDVEAERRLADDLVSQTRGALDEDAAACVAQGLYEEFGADSFRAVLDAAADRRGRSTEVRVRVIEIFAGCDALGAVIDQAS